METMGAIVRTALGQSEPGDNHMANVPGDGEHNATANAATNNNRETRNVTFDDDNELTRIRRAGEAGSTDDNYTTIPRSQRDSGVDMNESTQTSSAHLKTAPASITPASQPATAAVGHNSGSSIRRVQPERRPLDTSMLGLFSTDSSEATAVSPTDQLSYVSPIALVARDSLVRNNSTSLGPHMEQWRREEAVRRTTGEPSGMLRSSRPLSRHRTASMGAGQDDNANKRGSLGPSMERWRLEEVERNHDSKPVSPALRPVSPHILHKERTFSSSHENRPSSLGPAMERWRQRDLHADANTGSETGSAISGGQDDAVDDGRPITLGPAMERWRRQDVADAHTEGVSPYVDPARGRHQDIRPTSSGKDVGFPPVPNSTHNDDHTARPPTLGPAMERWRREEEQRRREAERNGEVVPSADSLAREASPRPTSSHAMTLGPAMEAWRREEVS